MIQISIQQIQICVLPHKLEFTVHKSVKTHVSYNKLLSCKHSARKEGEKEERTVNAFKLMNEFMT